MDMLTSTRQISRKQAIRHFSWKESGRIGMKDVCGLGSVALSPEVDQPVVIMVPSGLMEMLDF